MARVLRIGTLGAAKITPPALLDPARAIQGVEVRAVAARDRGRAEAFAAKHGIPRVHADYAALLADPDLDAIYNPLPISLHREWTERALRAGKHVLCEKPFASNAAEARAMADCAEVCDRVLFEAFHYRYHPFAKRVRQLLDEGAIGRVEQLDVRFEVPIPQPDEVRFGFALSGGCTMDVGCYTLQMLRYFGPGEPEVVRATPRCAPGDARVDEAMRAELRYPNGATGRLSASMVAEGIRLELVARGPRGVLTAVNPVQPQLFNRIVLETPNGRSEERVEGEPTYTHQLRAFAAAVLDGAPFPTGAREAIRNMQLVDAVYRAAGLPLRGSGP